MVSFLAFWSLDSKACSFHLFRNVRFCCRVVGTSCGLFWCGEQERLALLPFWSMLTCFWIQKLALFLIPKCQVARNACWFLADCYVAENKKDWFFLPSGLSLHVSGFKSCLFCFPLKCHDARSASGFPVEMLVTVDLCCDRDPEFSSVLTCFCLQIFYFSISFL